MFIYVYLCGYYSSEDYRGKHTLGIYHNEKNYQIM